MFHVTNNGNGTANQNLQIIQIIGDVTINIHPQPQQAPPTSSAPPAGSPPSSDLRGSIPDVMTGTRLPSFSFPPFPAASRNGFAIKSEPTEAKGSMSKQPAENSNNELMPRRLIQKEVKVEQVEPAPSSTARNVLEGSEIGEQESNGMNNALKYEETPGHFIPIADTCSNHGGHARSNGVAHSCTNNLEPIKHIQSSDHPKFVSGGFSTSFQQPNNSNTSTGPTRGVSVVQGSRKRVYPDGQSNSSYSHKKHYYATTKGFWFALVNVELKSPKDDAHLQAEARRLNVEISAISSFRMPCGNNRFVQAFMICGHKNRDRMREERVKEDYWKSCWSIEHLVNDKATPFFWGSIQEKQVFKLILCATKLSHDEKDTSQLNGVLGSIDRPRFMSRRVQDTGFNDDFKRKLNNEGHREWEKMLEWIELNDAQRRENERNVPGPSTSYYN
ncbi:hypothetical protein CRE_30200 [Caenorhabditis remanei]|uniref:Uncharacterized protein n=1 Tax=Caenorhabditis remanei TaxID=31234 RepID=E3NGN1_CAERE|nr:hypothetical protein CRE_30200 [Caenorhabditis remanei]